MSNSEVAQAVWDRAGTMRSVRRGLDLSQRELASVIGVSASTINAAESPGSTVSLDVILRILQAAGLQLTVMDPATGHEVQPEPADVERDHQGRRFPVHLDARPAGFSDILVLERRPGRVTPQVTFNHRSRRDWRRASKGTPHRHPTTSEVRWARKQRDWSWPRPEGPESPPPSRETPTAEEQVAVFLEGLSWQLTEYDEYCEDLSDWPGTSNGPTQERAGP